MISLRKYGLVKGACSCVVFSQHEGPPRIVGILRDDRSLPYEVDLGKFFHFQNLLRVTQVHPSGIMAWIRGGQL
jgi:hypothetical protein